MVPTLDDYPIGSLVHQNIYDDKHRYGVVFKKVQQPALLWVYWQLNELAHAVSNESYTEAIMIAALRPEKYLVVIALPTKVEGEA
jgi:hypothetical protein